MGMVSRSTSEPGRGSMNSMKNSGNHWALSARAPRVISASAASVLMKEPISKMTMPWERPRK